MESMDRLKDMLQCEIDKIADQGELTAGSLETIGKLLDAVKDISEINAMDDYGYSQRGYGRMPMYYEGSYEGATRGGRSSRRGGNGGNSRRMGYSYDDGKDYMIDQLEQMMDQAGSEKERQAIMKCIRQMEQA